MATIIRKVKYFSKKKQNCPYIRSFFIPKNPSSAPKNLRFSVLFRKNARNVQFSNIIE